MRYREHRYPCNHPVSVSLPDGASAPAVIVNVSQWGARLARVSGLLPEMPVLVALGLGHPPVEAHVRWVHGGYAGIRFARRLDNRTMALIRKSVGHHGPAPSGQNGSRWNLHLRELR